MRLQGELNPIGLVDQDEGEESGRSLGTWCEISLEPHSSQEILGPGVPILQMRKLRPQLAERGFHHCSRGTQDRQGSGWASLTASCAGPDGHQGAQPPTESWAGSLLFQKAGGSQTSEPETVLENWSLSRISLRNLLK